MSSVASVTEANLDQVQGYVRTMYSKKPALSNYFNQSICVGDRFIQTTDSFVIIKDSEHGFNRVYFMSTNSDQLTKLLGSTEGFLVINLPSKGDIAGTERVLVASGYQLERVYERWFNQKIVKRTTVADIHYATPEDIDVVYDLFWDYFIPYVDYIPDRTELLTLIDQHQILINTDDTGIRGAFVYEIQGKKCYLRAWIDHSAFGMKLLFDVYTLMYEKGLTYAYFWVNSTNEQVINIHKMLGAQPDGLKDYTFVKK